MRVSLLDLCPITCNIRVTFFSFLIITIYILERTSAVVDFVSVSADAGSHVTLIYGRLSVSASLLSFFNLGYTAEGIRCACINNNNIFFTPFITLQTSFWKFEVSTFL